MLANVSKRQQTSANVSKTSW